MMIHATRKALTGTLLVTASTIAMAGPAHAAHESLFASDREIGAAAAAGGRVTQSGGVTQVRLDNGGIASFVDAASYRINADGSIDLYSGTVTVSGAAAGAVVVRLADKGQGRVSGVASAASFSVDEEGASGHVLTGTAQIALGNRNFRAFSGGELWRGGGGGPRLVVANGEQKVPSGDTAAQEPAVLAIRDGGPAAAAVNGLPVVLGDALAAAGASGDILTAARRIDLALANPALETFPTGDFETLAAYAAGLEAAYGGTPFAGAQADIIRTYLQFLADGGARADFVTAYAGLTTQYLAVIRAGAAPASFTGASLAQIGSYLAYLERTSGFAGLSAQNRVLVEAYLAFLADGGTAQGFSGRYTGLTEAYFSFLRAGGVPGEFELASQQLVDQYLSFLRSSGLDAQLTEADRALLASYLDNGGFAFSGQYQAALDAYFAFLSTGGLPSAYGSGDPALLQSYLETLQAAGLFGPLLGERAEFFAAYLAHLQNGGQADSFAGLPATVFADYAGQLEAWFSYLDAGGLPSAYSGDTAQLRAYLAALSEAGALDRFLGSRADFYAAYLAHLQGGGTLDSYAGLNANVFAGYAAQLQAYHAYLLQGGVPSAYGALTQAQIAAYLTALQQAGASTAFLSQLSGFYAGYFAYLQEGGNPDIYTGLPVVNLPAFADALNAYHAYLAGGGLPSTYSAAQLDVLGNYFQALVDSGQASALLGGNLGLLDAYFAALDAGNAPDQFSGLPAYTGYSDALGAYFAFLQGGGLPGDYTALTQAQVQAYLAALGAAGGLSEFFGTELAQFYSAYFAFIQTGGNPAEFSGLPAYVDYAAAIGAYYDFLQGGGLPGDYTALTQAQVQAYLAALQSAGGFDLQLGSLASFFGAYYAHIEQSGDPAGFGGLPLYGTYAAALQAYYSFLAGGGSPSAYTGLTQAQINAYIAALDSVGVLGGLLAAQAGFLSDYLAFVDGGGLPDDFGLLPINGGTLGGYALVYQGGYSGTGSGLFLRGAQPYDAGSFGQQIAALSRATAGPNAFNAVLDSQGGLLRYTASIQNYDAFRRGSAGNFDIYGDASVLIGRWSDGDYFLRGSAAAQEQRSVLGPNQGFHYMLANGYSQPSAFQSGRVDYALLAATSPTLLDGSLAPGVFEADAALVFGVQPKFVIDGSIAFTGPGGFTYSFATPGGIAGDGSAITISQPGNTVSGGYFNFNVAGTTDDGRSGSIEFESQIVDTVASRFGTVYSVGLANGSGQNQALIQGAAIFGAVDGGSSGATGAPYAGRQTGLWVFSTRYGGSATESWTNATVDFDASGLIGTYTNRLGSTAGSGNAPADAAHESGSIAGALAWARFLDPANASGVAADTGVHVIVGEPALNLPTTGLVSYALIGGTRPTTNEGTEPAGSFAGDLAVDFASRRVGIDFDIAIADYRWNMRTAGGASDPANGGFSLRPTDPSFFGSPGVTALTAASCTASCAGALQGMLFGEGAGHAGVVYQVTDGGFVARGSAIFAAPNAFGTGIDRIGTLPVTGGGTGGGGVTSTRDPIVYYTYTNGSLASGFGGSADLVDGELAGFSSFIGDITATTAQIVEAGDLGDLAWARWTNGNVVTTGVFASTLALGANGGYHVMAGTASTSLPASGKVDYALTASTSATDNLGSTPGTVAGQLAIQFGSTSTVGYNLAMNVGGRSWSVATPGGAANPSSGVNLTLGSAGPAFGGVFTSTSGTVAAGGGACAGSCVVNISGTLYGANGAYAGVAMNVTDASAANGTISASGLAIFTAQPQYGYNPYARMTDDGVAKAGAIAPQAAWDRFESGEAPAAALATTMAAGRAITAVDAQAILGGMVTFKDKAAK